MENIYKLFKTNCLKNFKNEFENYNKTTRITKRKLISFLQFFKENITGTKIIPHNDFDKIIFCSIHKNDGINITFTFYNDDILVEGEWHYASIKKKYKLKNKEK